MEEDLSKNSFNEHKSNKSIISKSENNEEQVVAEITKDDYDDENLYNNKADVFKQIEHDEEKSTKSTKDVLEKSNLDNKKVTLLLEKKNPNIKSKERDLLAKNIKKFFLSEEREKEKNKGIINKKANKLNLKTNEAEFGNISNKNTVEVKENNSVFSFESDYDAEENKPKKLRKHADIIREKEEAKALRKKQRKMVSELFFEKEADLGSDNEEHDDIVKDVRKEEEEDYLEEKKLAEQEENGEEEYLKDLVDLDYEKNITYKDLKKDEKLRNKFIVEELENDREMIKKIINFDYNKRKNKLIDEGVISDDEEKDQNYMTIEERFKKTGVNEDIMEGESDMFKFQMFNHYKKSKIIANENYFSSENEETKELLALREESQIKRLAETHSVFSEHFKNRLKENKEILSNNVIDLNEKELKEEQEKELRRGIYDNPKKELQEKKNLVFMNSSMFLCKTNSLNYQRKNNSGLGKMSKMNSSCSFISTNSVNSNTNNTINTLKTNGTFGSVNSNNNCNSMGYGGVNLDNKPRLKSSISNLGFTKASTSTNNQSNLGKKSSNLSTLWQYSNNGNGDRCNNTNKGVLLLSGKKVSSNGNLNSMKRTISGDDGFMSPSPVKFLGNKREAYTAQDQE